MTSRTVTFRELRVKMLFVPTMTTCTSCWRDFIHEAALHAHCRDKNDHAYCVQCERLFKDFQALHQHLRNSSLHASSESDSDEYNYDESEDESEDESDDDEGRTCPGRGCNRWLVNAQAQWQHLAASSSHNWCFICSKDFATSSALTQHQSSRVHSPRDYLCPLCRKAFNVPSAIALHIESGGCNPNITRHTVTRAIQSLPIVPTITLNRRLTNGNSALPRTITNYTASERAFNGKAYECYLCHRLYSTLSSLNAHLNSPAHDQNEFQCPKKKCGKKFKLVSGFIQHVESEVCGVARFKQVADLADDFTNQFSRMLRL